MKELDSYAQINNGEVRRIENLNYRKEEQPGIMERLIEYTESDAYPFHMPGHKRQEITGQHYLDTFGFRGGE